MPTSPSEKSGGNTTGGIAVPINDTIADSMTTQKRRVSKCDVVIFLLFYAFLAMMFFVTLRDAVKEGRYVFEILVIFALVLTTMAGYKYFCGPSTHASENTAADSTPSSKGRVSKTQVACLLFSYVAIIVLFILSLHEAKENEENQQFIYVLLVALGAATRTEGDWSCACRRAAKSSKSTTSS